MQLEMEEREERKRMQEQREHERRQEEEKERLLEQKQVQLTNTQKNCSAKVLLAVDAHILCDSLSRRKTSAELKRSRNDGRRRSTKNSKLPSS